MGKNKNRNRRNKKNNEQILDIEIKFSPSANINCAEVNKKKKRSNSKKMSCSNPKDFESAINLRVCKENSSESKEQNFTRIENKNMKCNLAKKAQPLSEVCYEKEDKHIEKTFPNKMQYYVENNYEKKVQPLYIENVYQVKTVYQIKKESQIKNEQALIKATSTSSTISGYKNYKAKPYIENENQVKNEQALVKTSTSATIYSNKNSDVGKLKKSNPEIKSYPESVPASKTTGAIPKSKPQFGNSTFNEHLKIKQAERNSQLFSRNIQGSVRKYEKNWEKFKRLYHTWKSQRENTIKELKELVENVHTDQRGFNKGNLLFKELNVVSREIKGTNESPAVDFLTSLATFVTDAASGITSVVQACNADIHTTAFKKIMENDAEITKPLYAARSQCLEEYQNVEEMIRECHLKTFGNTIDDISDTLKVEDLLSQIKSAKGDDCLGQIIGGVATFIQRNANLQVMGEINNSFHVFLDSNPAVVEACKSAGKALYGVYDTWGRDHKQGRASIQGNMSIVSNKLMLLEQRRELDKLRSIVDNDDENQAKLESEIHYAISSLQGELMEMDNIFENNNRSHYGNHPWYF